MTRYRVDLSQRPDVDAIHHYETQVYHRHGEEIELPDDRARPLLAMGVIVAIEAVAVEPAMSEKEG